MHATGHQMERVTGIEPALSAWEADVLPLNYTRVLKFQQDESSGPSLPRVGV